MLWNAQVKHLLAILEDDASTTGASVLHKGQSLVAAGAATRRQQLDESIQRNRASTVDWVPVEVIEGRRVEWVVGGWVPHVGHGLNERFLTSPNEQ